MAREELGRWCICLRVNCYLRSMNRDHAIEKLALMKLAELSENERSEQLEIMTFEGWSQNKDWHLLPADVINEFEERELSDNANSKKYDQVLMIWLKKNLESVTNEFLLNSLNIDSIEGEPIKLLACPCCGRRTIEERGNYEICRVCWWEDDGQDNDEADQIFGGPNYGISLTNGRFHFLKFGIYDPNREDLINNKEPMEKYEKGREFELNGEFVVERGTNWKGKVKTNS